MKHNIITTVCCAFFVAMHISSYAQDNKAPDPFAGLPEAEIKALINEHGASVVKSARAEDVAILMLDQSTSIKMGKLKVEYNNNSKAIKEAAKNNTEYIRGKGELKKQYHSELISLIGKEKFTQWQEFMEMNIERTYMKKHGFSDAQIASFSHKAFKATQTYEIKHLELTPEIAVMMGELIVSYNEQWALLKDSGLSMEQIRAAREILNRSHENNIRILIGEEKYRIWKIHFDETPKRSYIKKYGLTEEQVAKYSIEAFVQANRKEIYNLHLTPLKALEAGELKSKYIKLLDGVSRNQNDWKKKRVEIKNRYRQEMKLLLSPEKFKEWIDYHNSSLERKYMEIFGFTYKQFQAYQDLENQLAVDILRIKSSAIPKEEKGQRIQSAKDAKVENLRKVLDSEQFAKWHKAYLKEEKTTTNDL